MLFPQYSNRKLDKIDRIFKEGKLRFVCCDLCGRDDYHNIFEEMGFFVVKCNSCGFFYTNPIPVEVHISDSEEELQKDIHQLDQKKFVYQGILKSIAGFKKKGRLLDVGCGMGYFIQLADKAGYNPTGIDLNRKRVEFLKKNTSLDIHYGTLNETGCKDGSFQIVTLLEILEHVPDPTKLMLECHRILEDNGVLVIEVPNVTFQLAKARLLKIVSYLTGSEYYGVMPFMHLVHFNTRTLSMLIQKCGFRLLKFEPRKYYTSPGDSAIIKCARRLYCYMMRLLFSVSRFNADTALVTYAMKINDQT